MKRKKGFTLVELSAVLGVAGTISLIGAQESKFERDQARATALGAEMVQYNTGVSRFLADNAADPSAVTGTYAGSAWLKSSTCGGPSPDEYIGCHVLENGRTLNFQVAPTTTITERSDGGLKARTVWTPVTGESGGTNGMAMGIATLAASGSYVAGTGTEGASGYQGPHVYCPDITSFSASITAICETDNDRMISLAASNANLEPWLRTDHGNTQHHVIEFDDGSGAPMDVTTIESVDGSNWRQIINISRLYNRGATGNDSIIIGQFMGENVYSDSFITSQGLLQDAAIIDGDVGVMRDLYVKANASIDGNISAGGDITAAGSVNAGLDVTAARNISAGQDAMITRDIYAGRDLTVGQHLTTLGNAQVNGTISSGGDISSGNDIVSARDITSGRNIRSIGNIRSEGTLHSVGRISTSTGSEIYSGGDVSGNIVTGRSRMEAPIFFDRDDNYYRLDPTDFSRIDKLRLKGRLYAEEYISIESQRTVGGSCSPNGLLSKSSGSDILMCRDGRWKMPSGTLAYGQRSSGGTYSFSIPQPGIVILKADGHRLSSGENDVSINVYVNGNACGSDRFRNYNSGGGFNMRASASCIMPVSAGTVSVRAKATDTYGNISSTHVKEVQWTVIPR